MIPKKLKNSLLGMKQGDRRFSAPNGEYLILYTALNLETAIRETLIRDEFDDNRVRVLPRFAVESLSNVVIDSVTNLNLIDLNDGKPNSIGLPSDIHLSKNYDRSGAFALEVFTEMPEADGFYYRSRHDDKICYAVFERSVISKLRAVCTFSLSSNPAIWSAYDKLIIKINEND